MILNLPSEELELAESMLISQYDVKAQSESFRHFFP